VKAIPEFEWDTAKNTRNIQAHGIAFDQAKRLFYQPYHTIASPRRMKCDSLP